MSVRHVLSACLLAAAALPALAASEIIVETAPPPLREETMPAPRTGYVWAPGYWFWENGTHVWRAGHWIETHDHSHWVPDTWEKRDDRHWRFVPGHWEDI